MVPNYIYSYSKSHSYLRRDFVPVPYEQTRPVEYSLNIIRGNFAILSG